MSGFLDSLAKYQDIMKQLQTQAKKLMMVSNGNISLIRGLITTLFVMSGNQVHTLQSSSVPGWISNCKEEFPGTEAEGRGDPEPAAGGGVAGGGGGGEPGAAVRHRAEGPGQGPGRQGDQEHHGGASGSVRRGEPIPAQTQELDDVL